MPSQPAPPNFVYYFPMRWPTFDQNGVTITSQMNLYSDPQTTVVGGCGGQISIPSCLSNNPSGGWISITTNCSVNNSDEPNDVVSFGFTSQAPLFPKLGAKFIGWSGIGTVTTNNGNVFPALFKMKTLSLSTWALIEAVVEPYSLD